MNEQVFSDGDRWIALFHVVASLAEKVTGQHFRVRVENDKGDFIWISSRLCHHEHCVEWSKETEAPANIPESVLEHCRMPSSSPNEFHALSPELPRAFPQMAIHPAG